MGKSTAAQWLQSRGIAVVDTDELSRAVVEPGQPALREVEEAFGRGVIGPDGQLRRDELARIVFADTSSRKKLETILHPRIRQLWLSQLGKWREENRAVAVVVIPLLFETGAEKEFDAVVCVACSAATQQERLRSRGWTDDSIRSRNTAQLPVDQKMERSNYVAWTEGELDVLHRQLERIFTSGCGG